MIIIKKIYSWFNVYIDNTLILKNLNQNDIDDILKVLKTTKENYKINEVIF